MKLTPGMKQYMEQKQKYPDCILLFRMGDFYETFFNDAIKVSQILNITLTSRGKGETKAPLAGIPYHALERYLGKLIASGNKVAICEQVEDPKTSKGIVKREVVRIVTPGTIVEDSMLSEKSNNYVASIFGDGENYGVSFVDVSTGDFIFTEAKKHEVMQELFRKNTAELIYNFIDKEIEMFCKKNSIYLNRLDERNFWINNAMDSLKNHYGKESSELGFLDHEFALCSAGSLLTYLHETQKQSLSFLKKPKIFKISSNMVLDSSTIKNLELLKNVRGEMRGSLLSVLDRTSNAMGGRLLKQWITHPLKNVLEIKERQFAVKQLFDNVVLCTDVGDLLSEIFDIERLVSRIAYRLVRPADLVNLKNSLKKLDLLKELLSESVGLFEKLICFEDVSSLIKLIDDSIAEESKGSEMIRSGAGYSSGGSGKREIGIIKDGYNSELDELYALKFETKKLIHNLEVKEQERTGFTLKVGYNRVFGYFIEVSNRFKDKIPDNYIRKQTLVNGERFITEELKEFEEKLLKAEERIVSIESKILDEVISAVIENTDKIQKISKRIATIDILCSFAKVSYEENYILPEVNENYELHLVESRHPVVEKIEGEFIPNDCLLKNEEFLMMITGPNMAGKSTYMRQVALNILMAQIGCFVPCSKAKIGVVDRIFTRVGANDDLTMGQSTFMVEMLETAEILNNATDRSFIILDEIGRGTSTFDGVAIAWSVAEYILNKNKSKTLFATHYHVLTKLEEHELKGVVNYNIAVAENNDEIIFLRKIRRGGTDRSYGIHVAKLAGLPLEVINNAKKIQLKLEGDADLSQRIVVERKSIKLGKNEDGAELRFSAQTKLDLD